MLVDNQGYIKDITTISSSGSDELDQVLKQELIKARLKTFDEDGNSLAGMATIALQIDVS